MFVNLRDQFLKHNSNKTNQPIEIRFRPVIGNGEQSNRNCQTCTVNSRDGST